MNGDRYREGEGGKPENIPVRSVSSSIYSSSSFIKSNECPVGHWTVKLKRSRSQNLGFFYKRLQIFCICGELWSINEAGCEEVGSMYVITFYTSA